MPSLRIHHTGTVVKRINLYIPEQHYDWLSAKSEELGISAAEIVRRALADLIEEETSQEAPTDSLEEYFGRIMHLLDKRLPPSEDKDT